MHQAVSGGYGQAGRVLEFVHKRLEQQNSQKMSQNMRSGGTFVDSWWSLQADQTLEPLEGEFNPPSQAIEGENIRGCEVVRLQ